jgi:hypothetical protein
VHPLELLPGGGAGGDGDHLVAQTGPLDTVQHGSQALRSLRVAGPAVMGQATVVGLDQNRHPAEASFAAPHRPVVPGVTSTAT